MVKIDLEYPIDYDGSKITSIELNRPKMKHIKKMSADPTIEDLMGIACKLTGHPNKIFDEMDATDGMKVVEAIGNFLANGPGIGKS